MRPVPILLYHRIDHSGDPFTTTPEVFDSHLSWLAEENYRSIRPGELDAVLDGKTRPAAKTFMLTFDDGFADLETTVAPMLRRHDFSATAFLITNRVITDLNQAQAGPADAYLSWASARSLASDGLFDFHSHTHSHQQWPFESDAALVVEDIETSVAMLADELGRPRKELTHLAWPFGRASQEWEEAARTAGLSTQYIVQRGAVNRAGRQLRLPRLMADGYSLNTLKGWMSLLTNQPGTYGCNQMFGRMRELRHRGVGYR